MCIDMLELLQILADMCLYVCLQLSDIVISVSMSSQIDHIIVAYVGNVC